MFTRTLTLHEYYKKSRIIFTSDMFFQLPELKCSIGNSNIIFQLLKKYLKYHNEKPFILALGAAFYASLISLSSFNMNSFAIIQYFHLLQPIHSLITRCTEFEVFKHLLMTHSIPVPKNGQASNYNLLFVLIEVDGPQPFIEEGGVGPFKTTASILYITVQKITKINKLLKLLTSL